MNIVQQTLAKEISGNGDQPIYPLLKCGCDVDNSNIYYGNI